MATSGANGAVTATLTSVVPRVVDVSADVLQQALAALRWSEDELDPALPPRIGFAGARHLVIAAASRERLRASTTTSTRSSS